MAATYDLVADFIDPADSGLVDCVSTSPGWVVVVVRLGLPLSYSRKKLASVDDGDHDAVARLRAPNLIITSDCTSLSIQASKRSHTKGLNAQLIQTDHNYLTEILPGDWVLAWIVNDQGSLRTLIEKIKKSDPSDPCNGASSGLKFVGRADSIRKQFQRDSQTGKRTSVVTLSAVGFRELDTSIFYDPSMGEADLMGASIGDWLAKMGVSFNSVFAVDIHDEQTPNARFMISTLIDLLVGKGVGPNVNGGHPEATQALTGGGSSQEAPYAYAIPRVVGALLGNTNASKPGGVLSYADILHTLMGVQGFSRTSTSRADPYIFLPDLQEDLFKSHNQTSPFGAALEGLAASATSNRMYTGQEILGVYLPSGPSFINTPLWSVLQQYQNDVVNEMYTALRVGPAGLIEPTLVFRQIPFTTNAFQSSIQTTRTEDLIGPPNEDGNVPTETVTSTEQVAVTRFLDMPRWRLHPVLVPGGGDIGRSDATRFNFIHLLGQNSVEAPAGQVDFSFQLVENPPVRDDVDLQRSGLRPYIKQVACRIKSQIGLTPKIWMALVADWLIGSQYTLNGTLTSVGIQAPVAEGDNLEFDGVVYHIESVSHRCAVVGSGQKSFVTSFALSNGMLAGAPDHSDFPYYPGFNPEDLRTLDPGLSIEDRYDRGEAPVDKGDLVLPDVNGNGPPAPADPDDQVLGNQPVFTIDDKVT